VTVTLIENSVTHSTRLNCVSDFLDKLSWDPVLPDEAFTTDVDVEHIEMMVDGLHLADFAQPHVDML